MPFNQIQVASIGDWRGEADHPGWRRVKESLAALCGPGGSATAPTAPAARPSPAPATTGASAPGGSQRLLVGLVAVLTLIILAGGAYLWTRGGAPAASGNQASASPTLPVQPAEPVPRAAPMPPTAAFTQQALVVDPDGYTTLRGGPSALSPIVARVDAGATVATYPQTGDWWQVRTMAGAFGYMNRSRLRVREASAPAGLSTEPVEQQAALPVEQQAALPAVATGPEVQRAPPQVFPDSSRRLLSRAEVAGLSPAQARIARNEIFARHGRPFRDPALRRHFERYPWYRPRPDPGPLNRIEEANVRLLQWAAAKP
jgi:hypothetical protein